jgi:3D (Asp-Asp-Asp) domain-containing protein
MSVFATWYNASHGAWAKDSPHYGMTATGIIVDWGVCAVDPTVIPLGTKFYVPGYGMCLAADTGGLIKGQHIDLGFPEAIGDPGWGARTVDIYIISGP